MIRNTLFASLIALGAVGVAQAQDGGPRMIGGGENAQVVYDAPSHNVVGGGAATITGGADNERIAYDSTAVAQSRSGLVATLSGGGDNEQIVYAPAAAPTGTMLAGRPVRHGG